MGVAIFANLQPRERGPYGRVPTRSLTKNPGLSRTPMRNFPDFFAAHECLNITLPSPPDPCFPPLPLQEGPFKSN